MNVIQSRFLKRLRTVVRGLFFVCLSLWIVTYYYKDKLPPPTFYQQLLPIQPPKQTATSKKAWLIKKNKQSYLITPKYNYNITGVVVTGTKAGEFGDIWHYRHWKDYINVGDLCFIWGDNVKKGGYQYRQFSSDTWTCWVSSALNNSPEKFDMKALSNNHLLTNNEAIKKRLLQVEVGDVVSVSGWLVDYKNLANGYYRKTSTIRSDGGNGACETIFINKLKLIKKANPYIRALNVFAFYMLLLMAVVLIVFAILMPLKL